MLINRITAYLEDEIDSPTSGPEPTAANTATTPPAAFAPVPTCLLGAVPPLTVSWQEQLYRMAYEAAKAAVEAAAQVTSRSRWN